MISSLNKNYYHSIVERWRIDVLFVHDRSCLDTSNIACLELVDFTLNFTSYIYTQYLIQSHASLLAGTMFTCFHRLFFL